MNSKNTCTLFGCLMLGLTVSFLSMEIEGAAVPTSRTIQQSSACGVSESVKKELRSALGSYYIVRATDTPVRKINATELTKDSAECDNFFKADGEVNQRSECPWDYTIHREDATPNPDIVVAKPLCVQCRNKKHDANYHCESSWEVRTINKWDGCVYSEERIKVRVGSHCVIKMMAPSA